MIYFPVKVTEGNASSATLYLCVVRRNFTARRMYYTSAAYSSSELLLSFQFPPHTKHKVSHLQRPTNSAFKTNNCCL
jgi:hypothetical protein